MFESTANHTRIRDCWLFGEVQKLRSPLLGVPSSNWTELSPYSLYEHRHQCEWPGSPMGIPPFQLMLVNQSVTYIESNFAGPTLGYFNNTSNWTKIVPLPWVWFNKSLLVPSQQWHTYLYTRHTKDPLIRINVSCDFPDGYWWLHVNGVAPKQLPGNWTGQCMMGYLVLHIQMINHTSSITGIVRGI